MIAKSACKRIGSGNTAWLALSALLATAPAVAADPRFDADAVIEAFQASCDGYSSDELLIRDELRDSFLAALSKKTGSSMDARAERSALLQLLNLRKAGKLKA